MKETDVMRMIMIETSKNGSTLLRNNCGTLKNPAGIPVKFGLGNPGGSDLIGITPITITSEMVGKKVGVFTAIEVKTKTGRVRPEQIQFIDLVNSRGGIAGIARSVDDALALIKRTEINE